MVTKEQFNKLMKSMKSIEARLDVLVRLQKASMPKTKITAEEKKVLKLCDRKHTIKDLAEATGKSESNISFLLTQLRKKGSIRSVKSRNKLVYEKI